MSHCNSPLQGRHLEQALRAIFQLWGPTRGPARRRSIPQPLYDVWRDLNESGLRFEGERDWLAEYIADGSLVIPPAPPLA